MDCGICKAICPRCLRTVPMNFVDLGNFEDYIIHCVDEYVEPLPNNSVFISSEPVVDALSILD